MSPSAISTLITAFSMPAVAMAGMIGRAAAKTGHSAFSYAAAGAAGRSFPRLPRRIPPSKEPPPTESANKPSASQGKAKDLSTAKNSSLKTNTPVPSKPTLKPPMTRTQKGPKRRAVIEYKGALPNQALPANVMSIARIGKAKKL